MTVHSQQIVNRPTATLRPLAGNARSHCSSQVKQIADSIRRFGFTNPILVGEECEVIAGHGRLEAAKLLGLNTVPTICLPHLTDVERRAYVLADNKIALNAGWNTELLAIELEALSDIEFDVELTGFSASEIDVVMEEVGISSADPGDEPVAMPVQQRTRPGDLWQLGKHRLFCGDARDPASYAAVLGGEKADLIFTDPPYNISPAVRGVTGVKHRKFAMGAGEMSSEDFTGFLRGTLGLCASNSRDGAIAYICMDWRHMAELHTAGRTVFSDLKNVCVWNKHTGGLGKFYRSKHELIFVYKVGSARHTNNFGMGGSGRYRTNVWDYPGASGFRKGRLNDLYLHPTVKPVAMVADAIKDCSKRGQVILDAFAGSGTTLLAAANTGRRARLIEQDARFCDIILARYERQTGGIAERIEAAEKGPA